MSGDETARLTREANRLARAAERATEAALFALDQRDQAQAEVARLRAAVDAVRKHCTEERHRALVGADNAHPENEPDRWRWTGMAAAYRHVLRVLANEEARDA